MVSGKDWTGNYHSVCGTLGARNEVKEEREEHDYYATEPRAVELLMNLEQFNKNIWEPACGEGHISKVLEKYGYNVKSTDLIDRGFGEGGVNFFNCFDKFDGDIVTNPPYKYALEFVQHALALLHDGQKCCMFLKVQFLEGKARKEFFLQTPPKTVWVSSSRLMCGKNGKFETAMVAYAWYVWEKGYKGDTILKWFN